MYINKQTIYICVCINYILNLMKFRLRSFCFCILLVGWRFFLASMVGEDEVES